VSPYVRKVKTASGATAVQIVEKRGGRRSIVEHLGSAHDKTELAVLVSAAQQRLHGVQDDMLALETSRRAPSGPVVEHTASELLWRVLVNAYRQLGFVDDEVFTSLVAARIVEPTSKLDTVRVLGELGVPAPHLNTLDLRRRASSPARSRSARRHRRLGGP